LTDLGDSGMAWVGSAKRLSRDPGTKEEARRNNRTPIEQAEWIVEKRKHNVGKKMLSKFPTWVKGQGSFYPVGSTPQADSVSEDPSAYIKIMNVIFPSNKVGARGISQREALDKARDPNSSEILSIDDLFVHNIISGSGKNPDYYPLPEDEAGLKRLKQDLKGVKHISVVRYAEAISEYLANFVERDLMSPLEEPTKEAMSSFGLVKFSEKRNANMYYGGIINDEGLLALWNLINK